MSVKINVSEIFASNVFDDATMKQRLPKKIYAEFKNTLLEGKDLEPHVAEIIAHEMKEWAIEKGATHYTHWFQPLTNITAEKHDAFINPQKDGSILLSFSGKELIKGEPDGSSFPSGGIRATCEARGYTAWDCTSPAFIHEAPDSTPVLYIPTIFCSYTGEALDKKTPLLRSMEALSTQAMRIIKLFGDTTATKVVTSVGPEQEYFLVDKDTYDKRKDLIFTGRTLFGAPAPKGQELDDHYFGTIKERVLAYMTELNEELWKLGITAKTQHNEVAPAQHELAPIYDTTNIATDHNQLIMEIMKKVALRHNLVCLLHEKPFAGINGSGKHNNWSMSTDTGKNLLEPGDTPHSNKQFLLVLASILKAVDDYAPLLRMSAAIPGNDHRLGANEAPPAIISVFLGDQLEDVLSQLCEKGEATRSLEGSQLETGVSTVPRFSKDATDRNRTSPFAFTGNKFEFRMVGSSASIADPNIVLNTIVAETLCQAADILEKADDFELALHDLIKDWVTDHIRIIFNGDGYSAEWEKEAEKRGLPNNKNTVDALKCLKDEKNIEMLDRLGVYSKVELASRYEILLDNYIKTIQVEGLTALKMAKTQLYPAVCDYLAKLSSEVVTAKEAGLDVDFLVDDVNKLASQAKVMKEQMTTLENNIVAAQKSEEDIFTQAVAWRDDVFGTMQSLRETVDTIEESVDAKYWPIPNYVDLLFGI